ncbi:hypothetical protein EG329_008421 [Mollisiaceae sp. DMI_Dod_QoI]|nr:hypothetical protein EG329_008421 [Helotiales sp. DMI_Dod_QoI]
MGITVVLGSQWGDEGKGKLIDILCPENLLVCRAQGGNNAGHTIVSSGQTYDFHILPSGLLNPKSKNLIGSGCVVHIPGLLKELTDLESKGISDARERLYISDRAHVVLDLHQRLDGLEEAELKGAKIGTTGKGIGPCYTSRSGIRIADIFREDLFADKVRKLATSFKKRFGDLLVYDPEDEISKFKEYREILAPLVIDQLPLLLDAQQKKSPILVEGANAIMLDIDAGTYPYVTSSNTGLGGVWTGLGGLNPMSKAIRKAAKVGSGPFPSEALDEWGVKLQTIGREVGVTTGRPRRCGWLDLKLLQYSVGMNAYTALNLTKLDILDTFPEIKVAVNYRYENEVLESFPAGKYISPLMSYLQVLEQVEVEYVTLKGWLKPIGECRSFDELPTACQDYIKFVEEFLKCPIHYIGIGPKREDMIMR